MLAWELAWEFTDGETEALEVKCQPWPQGREWQNRPCERVWEGGSALSQGPPSAYGLPPLPPELSWACTTREGDQHRSGVLARI